MTTTHKSAASEHRMHTNTPGASCAPNCLYYTDDTTTTDTVIADVARTSGALLADQTPHGLALAVLQQRAKFGGLQDELNKASRQAGRVLSGPVADALNEITQGLDALYVELSAWRHTQHGLNVRDVAVALWSEPASAATGRTVAEATQATAVTFAAGYRKLFDQLARHTIDVVPQACLACDRFPCACDLMSVHVD